MNQNIDQFHDAIMEKIDYFRKEYSMTYAEVIGTLFIIALELFEEEKD